MGGALTTYERRRPDGRGGKSPKPALVSLAGGRGLGSYVRAKINVFFSRVDKKNARNPLWASYCGSNENVALHVANMSAATSTNLLGGVCAQQLTQEWSIS